MPLLGDVFLNTVYEENPERTTKITDHPIEDGGSTSDHAEAKPLTMKISGLVTGPDYKTRMDKLTRYSNTGERVNYTFLSFHPNMVVENFEIVRDVKVDQGFKFSIELKQVKISKPAKKVKLINKGRKQTQKKNDKKRKHTVVKGQSLWRISQKYYGVGRKWPTIYDANKSVIGSNPNLIKPGQVLTIP